MIKVRFKPKILEYHLLSLTVDIARFIDRKSYNKMITIFVVYSKKKESEIIIKEISQEFKMFPKLIFFMYRHVSSFFSQFFQVFVIMEKERPTRYFFFR